MLKTFGLSHSAGAAVAYARAAAAGMGGRGLQIIINGGVVELRDGFFQAVCLVREPEEDDDENQENPRDERPQKEDQKRLIQRTRVEQGNYHTLH